MEFYICNYTGYFFDRSRQRAIERWWRGAFTPKVDNREERPTAFTVVRRWWREIRQPCWSARRWMSVT